VLALALVAGAYAVGRSQPRPGRGPMLTEQIIADQSVRLWPNTTLEFNPDGMLLAVTGINSVGIWNVATLRHTHIVTTSINDTINGIVFSPDGTTLAIAAQGPAAVRLWDMSAGRLQSSLPGPRNVGFYSPAFSPDGRLLAASDDAGTDTYVWNVASRRVVAILHYPDAGISSLAFSPDGRTLAVSEGLAAGQGKAFGTVHLWSLVTHRNTRALHDSGRLAVDTIAYGPDGRLLAASDRLRIYVWNVVTGKIARTIMVRQRSDIVATSLAFSSDGLHIAATTNTGIAEVWDSTTGELVKVFRDPLCGESLSLAYSPDGRTLAVGCVSGRIDLWDASGLR